jgi:hypothetical protein
MSWICAYCDEVNSNDTAAECIVCAMQKTTISVAAKRVRNAVNLANCKVVIRNYRKYLNKSIEECKERRRNTNRLILFLAPSVFLYFAVGLPFIYQNFGIFASTCNSLLAAGLIAWLWFLAKRYFQLNVMVLSYQDSLADIHISLTTVDDVTAVLAMIAERKKITNHRIPFPKNNLSVFDRLNRIIGGPPSPEP